MTDETTTADDGPRPDLDPEPITVAEAERLARLELLCPCSPGAPEHEHGVGGYAVPTRGAFADYDERAYHAHPHLSNSGAKILDTQTPAHFRHVMDNAPVFKRAWDIGTGVHTLVLGIGDGIGRLDFADRRTKAYKEAEAEVRAAGLVPLLAADADQAQAMAEAVLAHPRARALFEADQGVSELSLFWEDDETGVGRRARLDRLKSNGARPIGIDLKTTVNADPAKFGKSAADFGYHMQHSYYLDGLEALGMAEPDEAGFVFVLVEKSAPHLVSVIELNEQAVDLGRAAVRRAVALFADCMREDDWPGYAEGIVPVSLPPWYVVQQERRQW